MNLPTLALSKSGSVEVFNFLSARLTSSRKHYKINFWRVLWQVEKLGCEPIGLFIFIVIQKVLYAGGAPARSGRLRRQRLHSVMNACKQSFATLVLHATAKIYLGRRFIILTFNSLVFWKKTRIETYKTKMPRGVRSIQNSFEK